MIVRIHPFLRAGILLAMMTCSLPIAACAQPGREGSAGPAPGTGSSNDGSDRASPSAAAADPRPARESRVKTPLPASAAAPAGTMKQTPAATPAGLRPGPDAAAAQSARSGVDAPTRGLAGPHPFPLLKTHFNKGMGKHVFKDRSWDLSQIGKAFNAVIVDYNDPQLIEDVRAAGLVAMVEFDEKDAFQKGKSVRPTVDAIVRLVRAHPGAISGIRIADRINQKLIPAEALAYMRETGGVFHQEIPGVPVIVDVEDWELTCGLPGQSKCTAHTEDDYRYCNNSVLTDFYKSGLVDGFEVAMNLKKDDPEVMTAAAQRARSLFPKPFLLYSRTASLSFAEDHFPGDAAKAHAMVAAYIVAPIRGGMDGIDLWAWHRPWKDELRTFMDKNGASNPLWDEMTKAYTQLARR